MVDREFHHVQTLLDLVHEGDVEEGCTKEPRHDDSKAVRGCLKGFHCIIARECLYGEEPEQDELTDDKESELSSDRLALTVIDSVETGDFGRPGEQFPFLFIVDSQQSQILVKVLKTLKSDLDRVFEDALFFFFNLNGMFTTVHFKIHNVLLDYDSG